MLALLNFLFVCRPGPQRSTLFPYTTLFRSHSAALPESVCEPQRSVRSPAAEVRTRSEEHTSELQSRVDLVCRLLLEKEKCHQLQSGKPCTSYTRRNHQAAAHL